MLEIGIYVICGLLTMIVILLMIVCKRIGNLSMYNLIMAHPKTEPEVTTNVKDAVNSFFDNKHYDSKTEVNEIKDLQNRISIIEKKLKEHEHKLNELYIEE